MMLGTLARSVVALMTCCLLLSPAAAQDVGRGKALYEACAPCHELGPASSEHGPSLIGVVGRRAGAANDFSYSRALLRAGIVWDEAQLDSYLSDPQASISGTRMPFSGIADAAERTDLIAYLKTLR